MRKNNKALYEQIMRNVSREVKRSLNEATYTFESDKSDLFIFRQYENEKIQNYLYKITFL